VFQFRYITQSEAETIPLVVNKNKNCTKRTHFIEAEMPYREDTKFVINTKSSAVVFS
jgi:uncharacterized UPF0160 family protein